jgi:uncharacterized protein (TIGR00730 family)
MTILQKYEEYRRLKLLETRQSKKVKKFLSGPKSRGSELWFALQVFWEFIRGFRKLHFIGPCVTVFGSARFDEDHPYYQSARKLGFLLAEKGFTIMTGGGPGIMEAANRGAYESEHGLSIGCNIILPREQKENPYLDRYVNFNYFFVRKVLLVKYSYAFVIYPGGFGTLDELFETLTLIQTRKIDGFPVVVVGKSYWQPVLDLVDRMIDEGTISPEDKDLFLVTDSEEEATEFICKVTFNKFHLSKRVVNAPSPILFEESTIRKK